jgi:FlgD Ig-like domain
MKKILFFLLCLITSLSSQTIDWAWTESTGGSLQDYGSSIALTDEAIYVTGSFKMSSMFGTTELVSSGGYDIFVGKMDYSGNWLWAVSAGGVNNDIASDIAVDNDENICLIGRYNNEINFGSNHLISEGASDIFVSKLDSDGNWLWAIRSVGENFDYGESIALDSENNVYITGSFWETATFGDSTFISAGADDFYVSKLNSNGEWIWSIQGSGEFRDRGFALNINDNNIFVSGGFNGPTYFGSIALTGDGIDDIFVIKLDQDGEVQLIAVAQSSTTSIAAPRSLFALSDGSIILTGEFFESLYFGLPTQTLSTNGEYDIFVAKLSEDFVWEWTASAGGTGTDYGNSLIADSDSNVWVTGIFSDSAVFGGNQLTSFGDTDIFVSVLSADGQWILAEQAGGTDDDNGYGVAINEFDEVFVTGYFEDTAFFGETSATSNGNSDIFVTALNQQTFLHDNEIPNSDILLSNYPNPFNPSTTISFSLSTELSENAELAIYNTKGQKVKTLPINSSTDLPINSINWDGIDDSGKPVSSGIYVYKLSSEKKSLQKKMLLLK